MNQPTRNLPKRQRLKLIKEGAHAHNAAKPTSSCPYDMDLESRQSDLWLLGWWRRYYSQPGKSMAGEYDVDGMRITD